MTTHPPPGERDTPETDPSQRGPTHPASDAASLRKLGGRPGDTEKMNISGHGAEGTAEPGSPEAAAHDIYWRRHFAERDYTDSDCGYEYYRPAYRYGWESRGRHPDRDFEEVEPQLESAWDSDRMGLAWGEARSAVRDAFERPVATEWSDPGNPLV